MVKSLVKEKLIRLILLNGGSIYLDWVEFESS